MLHTSTNSRISLTYNIALLFGVVPLAMYWLLDHPIPGVLTFWPFLAGAVAAGYLKRKAGLKGWWVFMCITSAAWPTMLTAAPLLPRSISPGTFLVILVSMFAVWTVVAMTVAIVSDVVFRKTKKGSGHG